MKKNKISSALIIFGSLLICLSAEAHQPNFVNKVKEIEISNPEISQAFYGFLDNEPVTYSINSDSPFKLYVGLLTPDLVDQQNDLFANIFDNKGNKIADLDGTTNFIWERWYEEFAGDWYWKGPEFKKEVMAGDYTITVSNTNNQGAYVLVVGELESFPVNQMSKMISELYAIKTGFFGKPWYSIFQNKIGEFLGIFILALIVSTTSIIFLIKFIRKRRHEK